MSNSELGWVLAVDEASNDAGVSLWKNGILVDTTVLWGHKDPVYSRRLVFQVAQLGEFLAKHLRPDEKIGKVVFEGVKNRLVLVTVGAYLTCPYLDAKLHQKYSFIESSSWKKWAQSKGATGPFKEIKGVKALTEAGWDCARMGIVSEDIADSILIYLTWRERDA
jgi:hypothetical protein